MAVEQADEMHEQALEMAPWIGQDMDSEIARQILENYELEMRIRKVFSFLSRPITTIDKQCEKIKVVSTDFRL